MPLLLHYLIEDTLHHSKNGANPVDEIIRSYREVLRGGALAHEIDSVQSQFAFVINSLTKGCAKSSAKDPVIAALERIRQSIAMT
jgi:hypothetical protein